MKKPYFFAAASIFCWSTVATVTKLLLNDRISNLQLLWISSLCAFLFLFFVNLFTGKLKQLRAYPPKDILISTLIGLPGTLFYYVFYYFGTSQMPASQAFIINYLWPIMSVLFAALILKERVTFRNVLGIGTSFLGIIVIMLGELGKQSTSFFIGAVSCVLGAVSYGIFTALGKKYAYDKGLSMMESYLATFLLTTVINAVRSQLFFPTLLQWVGISWNGIFTMAIANTLWVLALDKGKTEKISNLAYITPFLSMVWVSLFLKERLALNSLLGFAIILLGIAIQLKKTRQPAPALPHK